MSGLDDILNLIDMQQKEAENSIIQAALKKAETIKADGEEKATNAYNSFMKNASADAEKDYENQNGNQEGTQGTICIHV